MRVHLRPRLAIVLVAGLLAPAASSAASSASVEQDLVVSATSGAARSQIAVSSASCTDGSDGSTARILDVRLVSGAPGAQRLAGVASSEGGAVATLVVPDWISAADPARIEASCFEVDLSSEDEDPVATEIAFDPVDFDVLDPAEPAVQAVTYSRTSLLVGQGAEVDLEGCFLAGSDRAAAVSVLSGDDLGGVDGTVVVDAGVELGAGADAATVPVVLSNGGTYASWSQSEGSRPVIEEVGEDPTTIEPGSHVAFPYCAVRDEHAITYLLYPPQAIDVTGRAPIDDLDLVVPDGTAELRFAGGSATVGDVTTTLYGRDVQTEVDFDRSGSLASTPTSTSPVPSPFDPAGAVRGEAAPAASSSGGSRAADGASGTARSLTARSLAGDEEPVVRTVTPGDDGTWGLSDVADFEVGFVRAYAVSGDPFADGWFYDPQIAAVQVAEEEITTTTSTTTTTTTAGPPPAAPIDGAPDYAG